jgi:hypothetical protein
MINKIKLNPIEPAPDSFRKGSFQYDKMKRDGMVAIYSVTHHRSGNLKGYEVVVLTNIADKVIEGTSIPAHEQYPSQSQFGRSGWYYMKGGEGMAEAKYAVLKANASKRKGNL